MFYMTTPFNCRFLVGLAALLASGIFAAPCRAAFPARPNIVLIIADDLGCDIDADPQELKSLIGDAKYPANLKELRTALDGWQRETADAVPAVRPPDGYDRETGAPLGKKSGGKGGTGK